MTEPFDKLRKELEQRPGGQERVQRAREELDAELASAAAGEGHAEKAKQAFMDAGGLDLPGDDSDVVPLGEGHAREEGLEQHLEGVVQVHNRGHAREGLSEGWRPRWNVMDPDDPASPVIVPREDFHRLREGLSREEIEVLLRHAEGWPTGYRDRAPFMSALAKLRGWLASPAPEGDEP